MNMNPPNPNISKSQKDKRLKFEEKPLTKVINLNPVFINERESAIIRFNSIFTFIFLILVIVIVFSILYYFFKIEILFIYNSMFSKDTYINDEKLFYNNFFLELQKLIETPVMCTLLPSHVISSTNRTEIYGKYFVLTNSGHFVESLNSEYIYFDNKEDCKKFIGEE